jgi:hypothetical protein
MKTLPRDISRLPEVIGWPAKDLVKKERGGKWVPRFVSVIQGGRRSGTKAQAAEDAIINVLSRLDEDHSVFESGRGLELKDDVIARRDGNPPPRRSGTRASILTRERAASRRGIHRIRRRARRGRRRCGSGGLRTAPRE